MARPAPEDLLRTDHVEADLARRSARGGAVSVVTQGARFLLSVASTMVLSRLLDPKDFGVMAVAFASIGLFGLVKDAGLASATVQQRVVDHRQVSTLFWATVGFSTIVSLAVAGLAPLLAWFYGDLRVRDVVLSLAAVPLVDGLGMQHLAILSRRMEFTRISAIDAVSMLAAFLSAVAIAWRGGGYWALVAQEVVGAVVGTALAWTFCRWRPGLPSRAAGIGRMVRFGLNLSGVRILTHLTNNLDTVFVGRFDGLRRAGVYERAFRVLTLPFQLVTGPLGSVVVPALSRLQGDPERYRVFYRQWVRLVYALSMPLVAFLFVDATQAVIAVLGARWAPMVPIYRALAPAAFFGRVGFVVGWLFTSTGRADRHLRWVTIAFVPMLVGYAIGVRWGAWGVAVAHSLVSVLLWYPAVVYCCRTAPVRPRDLTEQIWRPAILSIVAGVLLHLLVVGNVLPRIRPLTLNLVVHAIVYAAVYLALWATFPSGRRALRELFEQLRSLRGGGDAEARSGR
ncbi:MAG: lipopolysaccharide biosynthesis protein [Alphaproteobacteria bacterium]